MDRDYWSFDDGSKRRIMAEVLIKDQITHDKIKDSLNESIKKYIPNLIVNEISFDNDEIEELIIVKLRYTVTEGTFSSSDTIEITF